MMVGTVLLALLFLGLNRVLGQLSRKMPNYNRADIIEYGMSYCAGGYVRCPDGSCKLNRPLELCPGETCDQAMGFYYRKCNDGKRCYTMYDRCDGQLLCDDGSDEHDCSLQDCAFPFQRKYCPLDRLCVPIGRDCPTFQDFSCPGHKPIRCQDYSGCYSSDQICDGISDCSDSNDEKYCEGPTFETPVTSELTRSLTTLLGILGCIPIFGFFVFIHKYCETSLLNFKPRIVQTSNLPVAMRDMPSQELHRALQGYLAVRPGVRRAMPLISRPQSTHSNISNISAQRLHGCAPPYCNSPAHAEPRFDPGTPPPPYSSCTGSLLPEFTDLPPTYDEAVAHTSLLAPRRSSEGEGSLLIRLQF